VPLLARLSFKIVRLYIVVNEGESVIGEVLAPGGANKIFLGIGIKEPRLLLYAFGI